MAVAILSPERPLRTLLLPVTLKLPNPASCIVFVAKCYAVLSILASPVLNKRTPLNFFTILFGFGQGLLATKCLHFLWGFSVVFAFVLRSQWSFNIPFYEWHLQAEFLVRDIFLMQFVLFIRRTLPETNKPSIVNRVKF